MSDVSTHTQDVPPDQSGPEQPQTEIISDAPSSPPVLLPIGASPETEAVLEVIRRGLAPDADASAQAMAREICARIAQPHSASPPAALPPVRLPPVLGDARTLPPESPITAATRALSQLPPEQLLDMVIQRLRAALPAGAAVAEPKGVQFQLLPVGALTPAR